MVSWEEAEKLDYRARAKAGGRRELLKHFEYSGSSVAQPHSPSVDWFAHATPPTPEPLQEPHNSSRLTASWMTWDPEKPKDQSIKLPSISNTSGSKEGFPITTAKQKGVEDTKLPQVVSPRRKGGRGRDNVDFSRLMSLDYQREWLQQRERKQQQQKEKLKAKRAAQKKKLQDHSMKARQMAKVNSSPPKRFTMKKFSDVPPKLKLPPL